MKRNTSNQLQIETEMRTDMKNLLVGQSGGPTAVINASLYGVVKAALASSEIDHVYGMPFTIPYTMSSVIVHLYGIV